MLTTCCSAKNKRVISLSASSVLCLKLSCLTCSNGNSTRGSQQGQVAVLIVHPRLLSRPSHPTFLHRPTQHRTPRQG
ncbi:hypothetical protein K461DRAFT_141403 [Myriangium duriaei CBS 260.36]|uniref:Uncharacterized protein n=1 Tax=Myriangium duriaei CBS 260.36 TaxID=1168546 RepID=A0A9P4J1P3_9PEZI|nr:hypothetical protein K461DRAFT_141403 [Myriangium duriaei CBS 260.36]